MVVPILRRTVGTMSETLWIKVPVQPCKGQGHDCKSGYVGDRCEGCLRDGTRAELKEAKPLLG